MNNESLGTLFVVSTPIGNLGDMTIRAQQVLNDVDKIAAEDTRHSKRLLDHFGIRTPMFALHEHNESQKSEYIVELLQGGKSVALISDAGTPLISDPGFYLVSQVRQAGLVVVPIPGASALTAALSVSGLPSDRFSFEGFLPAKSSQRLTSLKKLSEESRTMIFYEAPHRIKASLMGMLESFGSNRTAVLAKELTKSFESVQSGTFDELLRWLEEDEARTKGEFVILVRGAEVRENMVSAETEHLMKVLMSELPLKQSAALASKISGIKKNELYELGLTLKDK